MAKANKEETTEAKETLYNKNAFLRSVKYKDRRDLINALLQDGKEYTEKEAERIINNYMKGKVI